MGGEWLVFCIALFFGSAIWLASEASERASARAASSVSGLVAQAVRAMRGAIDIVRNRIEAWTGLSGVDGVVSLGEASEMIDLICLGLSAGLSFDASLSLYCRERDTKLARRMEQACMSWQIGMQTREEALMDAAADLELRALESFATAVTQALTLGAPLASTLSAQSAECRAAHRAEVERNIERAPVKILIPTGTLILPALLLSIIGPLLAAGGMV